MALVTLIVDQATKLYALFVFDLPVREPVVVNPFINLIVVWNRGISYGLFQQHTDLGRWILIVVSILAAVALSVWIRRTQGRFLAASLALIVGGAIGNVIDRLGLRRGVRFHPAQGRGVVLVRVQCGGCGHRCGGGRFAL